MKYAGLLLGVMLVNFPSCGEKKEEPVQRSPKPPRSVQRKPSDDKASQPGASAATVPPAEEGADASRPPQPEESPSPPATDAAQPPQGSPASPPPSTPAGTTPAATPAASAPKTERGVEIIRYDPNADIDLAARYLDKIGSLIPNRRFNEMRVYVARLSRTLVYLEGHLPTVSLQVGLERVQTLLAQNQRDKAAAEIQRILGEIRSLPALSPSNSTVTALRDIADNLEGGGDIDTAREALSEIRIAFSSPADPSAVIQEIRSSLTSLEIAISRESPGVIQTQLEALRGLLSKLRAALTSATAPPPSKTP
ncbi:MAG: hypothetical protein NZT92_14435 [Abditibacteriales bacterium]|nr:hypothetical protein [Abditibacteriales bacterium]MDW8365450.1 hypothetical protein [Abditibacteriales bacterium]